MARAGVIRPKLYALNWVGGKSVKGTQRTGPWVASLLPDDTKVTYVEPFAGMLGVLLQRSKANGEIVNDINDRVVNWWRCLRDYPDELLRLVSLTPWSRAGFVDAVANLDNRGLSPVVRAAHFTTVVRQSIRSTDRSDSSSWRLYITLNNSGCANMRDVRNVVTRLSVIADRIRNVQIENMDAVSLLDRVADYAHVVAYCDPPYPTADQTLYEKSVDFGDLSDVLKVQKGRIAVSGYGSEWDHLGWVRRCHDTWRHSPGCSSISDRTEVLWMNYEPDESRLF